MFNFENHELKQILKEINKFDHEEIEQTIIYDYAKKRLHFSHEKAIKYEKELIDAIEEVKKNTVLLLTKAENHHKIGFVDRNNIFFELEELKKLRPEQITMLKQNAKINKAIFLNKNKKYIYFFYSRINVYGLMNDQSTLVETETQILTFSNNLYDAYEDKNSFKKNANILREIVQEELKKKEKCNLNYFLPVSMHKAIEISIFLDYFLKGEIETMRNINILYTECIRQSPIFKTIFEFCQQEQRNIASYFASADKEYILKNVNIPNINIEIQDVILDLLFDINVLMEDLPNPQNIKYNIYQAYVTCEVIFIGVNGIPIYFEELKNV